MAKKIKQDTILTRPAIVEAPIPQEPTGYEDTVPDSIILANTIIVRNRPLTLEEERHNRRVVLESIKHSTPLLPIEPELPAEPVSTRSKTKPLKEILGE